MYDQSNIMNKPCPAKLAQIIAALIEGNSIRSTCRMTGTVKGTMFKLLADVCESGRAPFASDRAILPLPV